MTPLDTLEPLAGIAAFVCALAVFLGAALDGPDVAMPVPAPIVGSAR